MIDEKDLCTHDIFWRYDLFPYALGSPAYWSNERRGWLAPEFGSTFTATITTLPIGTPGAPVELLRALDEEYKAAKDALHLAHLKKAVAALPWLATLPQYKDIA